MDSDQENSVSNNYRLKCLAFVLKQSFITLVLPDRAQQRRAGHSEGAPNMRVPGLSECGTTSTTSIL